MFRVANADTLRYPKGLVHRWVRVLLIEIYHNHKRYESLQFKWKTLKEEAFNQPVLCTPKISRGLLKGML